MFHQALSILATIAPLLNGDEERVPYQPYQRGTFEWGVRSYAFPDDDRRLVLVPGEEGLRVIDEKGRDMTDSVQDLADELNYQSAD